MVFGLEIWGVGIFEGKPVHPALDRPVEAEYSFGSLYPRMGSADWDGVGPDEQGRLLHTLRIKVDGETVLDMSRDTPDLSESLVYFGNEPDRGSRGERGLLGEGPPRVPRALRPVGARGIWGGHRSGRDRIFPVQ